MRLADIEPKRLQMVCHKADSAPSLVLIAGRRGGRPGLTAQPCLILCNPDGTPTEDVRRIYHMRSK
jgi:tRNA1Val (adenine37-N6)-methyltransferase